MLAPLANSRILNVMNAWKIRKGFVFGAAAGFLAAGTSLWAITSVQQLLHPPGIDESAWRPGSAPLPVLRAEMPPVLAWFFIQYPYVSERAEISPKNHHTYVIDDAPRGRRYVVTVSQRLRRVEIYGAGSAGSVQIHVYRPGEKRTVVIENDRIVSDGTVADGNLWMWKTPLWNERHLKIYSLADQWLNSPYKKYSCAGFVHKYLDEAGINVPVRDAWDMAKLPYRKVSLEEMEPGDIIALKTASEAHRRFWGRSITHVGVYIGHGKYIHAATAHRKARHSFIKLGEVDDIRPRIAVVLRPPELL